MNTKAMFVGLTGGIACGKNFVASLFAEKGCKIIDADSIAHTVMLPGEAAYEKVLSSFGNSILKPDGTIDRDILRSIVVYSKEKMKTLESIVHPEVKAKTVATRKTFEEKLFGGIIIYNIPLLFEAVTNYKFDYTILVYASQEKQLERVLFRGFPPYNHALKLMNMQMPYEDKAKLADYTINNNGTHEETVEEVDRVYNMLIQAKRLSAS